METLGSIMILLGILLFTAESAYSLLNGCDTIREKIQTIVLIIVSLFMFYIGITMVDNVYKQLNQEIVTNAPTKLNINGEEYLLIKNE